MANKLIDNESMLKFAKAFDARIKNKIVLVEERTLDIESDLTQKIESVKRMLGGKSLVYLTQEEYDALSEDNKNDETKMYIITDLDSEIHEHSNLDFLETLSQATFEEINSLIDALDNSKLEISDHESDMEQIENELNEKVTFVRDEILNANDLENIQGIRVTGEGTVNLPDEVNYPWGILITHLDNDLDGYQMFVPEYDSWKGTIFKRYITEHGSDLGPWNYTLDSTDWSEELLTNDNTILGAINETYNDIAELTAAVGKNESLNTENKDTVVNAINEIHSEVDIIDSDLFNTITKVIELDTYKAEKEDVDNIDSNLFNTIAKVIELETCKAEKENVDNINSEVEKLQSKVFDLITKVIELDLYKEDKDDEVIQNDVVNGVLKLTANKYQKFNVNKLNTNTVVLGKELNSSDTSENFEESANWYVTDYIPVHPGETYYKTNLGNSFYFYNNNKEWVGADGTSNSAVVIPEGVYYIKLNGQISLLNTAKFQLSIENIEIVLPEVNKFTEIHLYFNAEDEMNLVFPDDCKWRVDPNIEAGKLYEIVMVYNTMNWLANVIVYS